MYYQDSDATFAMADVKLRTDLSVYYISGTIHFFHMSLLMVNPRGVTEEDTGGFRELVGVWGYPRSIFELGLQV